MWIRSQDKKILIKAESIHIEYVGETEQVADYWCLYYLGANLGTYTSKERAIEVLDEIQKK